jgi:Ca-activated chloride channel homolog
VHLLAPWWWLLFIPLAGILILLYLLRLRRRDHLVPSTLLWEQALQDLQANVPFQKLRKHLLLFLQLLILLLAVAALSRPAFQWAHPGGASVVLVIDASASMASTDVSPSRFAVAKREAGHMIEGLGPRDRMMLIAVGGGTRALTPFTDDQRTLREALSRLTVTDCPGDLSGALRMISGLVKGGNGVAAPSVIVLSDGAMPPANLATITNVPVHFQKVGTRGNNVGIVMLDAGRQLTKEGGFEGLVAVLNASPTPRTVTMEITLDGTLRDAREITLPPSGRHAEVISDLPAVGGLLAVRLDVQDDLSTDNEARLLLPRQDPVKVTLATPGNVFLQAALSLDPTITVVEKTDAPGNLPRGSVLIADNVPVSTLPEGVSALVIGPESIKGLPRVGTIAGEVKTPRITDWDHRHPLMANVDLTGLHVGNGVEISPATGAGILIDSDRGPLAVTLDRPEQRVVALGWNLHDSDFPLRAGFPIFLGNCIDWLCGRSDRLHALNARTGEVVRFPAPAEGTRMDMTTPDGHKETLTPSGSVVNIEHVNRAGIYTVHLNQTDTRFTANLLNSEETLTTPRDQLASADQTAPIAATRGPVLTEREWWRVLLFLLLGVLCLEWWVYHRRIG